MVEIFILFSANQRKNSEPTTNQHKTFEPTANPSTKCLKLLLIKAQNVQTYSQSEHKMSEPTANQNTKC
jgi:hypothetical protein